MLACNVEPGTFCRACHDEFEEERHAEWVARTFVPGLFAFDPETGEEDGVTWVHLVGIVEDFFRVSAGRPTRGEVEENERASQVATSRAQQAKRPPPPTFPGYSKLRGKTSWKDVE